MSTFKTKNGLELPFLNLQGKDYLQVVHRVVWFRDEKPSWTIETDVVSIDLKYAVISAVIKDENGRVLQKAHGTQSADKFPAYVEKAESKAIGRALGFLGYGTAHAQELEDEVTENLSTLADSPVSRITKEEAMAAVQTAFPGATTSSSTKRVPPASEKQLNFLKKLAGGEANLEKRAIELGRKSYKDLNIEDAKKLIDGYQNQHGNFRH